MSRVFFCLVSIETSYDIQTMQMIICFSVWGFAFTLTVCRVTSFPIYLHQGYCETCSWVLMCAAPFETVEC